MNDLDTGHGSCGRLTAEFQNGVKCLGATQGRRYEAAMAAYANAAVVEFAGVAQCRQASPM